MERDHSHPAAALRVAAGPSGVHEQTPHHPGGKREEVTTVFKIDPIYIYQPKVRLVHESGGL